MTRKETVQSTVILTILGIFFGCEGVDFGLRLANYPNDFAFAGGILCAFFSVVFLFYVIYWAYQRIQRKHE